VRLRIAAIDTWFADDPEALTRGWIKGNVVTRGLVQRGFEPELVFPADPAAEPDLVFSGPIGKPHDVSAFESAIKILWAFENLANEHDSLETRSVACDCESFSLAAYQDHERYFDFAFTFGPVTERNFQITAAAFSHTPSTLSRTVPEEEARALLAAKTDFACFLYSQGCEGNDGVRMRNEFFRNLSRHRHVTSGGAVMNNVGGLVPLDQTAAFVARHKFVIAMENSSTPGYVTEKIFNGFLNGTVPIYAGAADIEQFFDARSFIRYRGPQDFERVLETLERLDHDDDAYVEMLAAPKIAADPPPELRPETLERRIDEIATRLMEKRTSRPA
jgi:hypothetical protein